MSEDRQPGLKRSETDAVTMRRAAGGWRIWFLLLAGPVIWFGHFMAVYLLADAMCTAMVDRGRLLGLPIVSTLTLLATLAAVVAISVTTVLAYRGWRADQRGEEMPSGGRDRALAFGGFAMGVLFLWSILLVGLPALWLSPC